MSVVKHSVHYAIANAPYKTVPVSIPILQRFSAINSLANSPNFFKAFSTRSFHGTAQLKRMQLPYFFWVAENRGPGAMMMFSWLARRCSSMASTPAGNSTHSAKPPSGWVTRVPSGNNRLTALTASATLRAYS